MAKDNRKKYNPNSSDALEAVGKLPPQAQELEVAVLGAVMLEQEYLNPILEILKPESFYNHQHATIFEAISSLHKQSYPVDIKTVVERLKSMEMLETIGGPYYIATLTNGVASAANAEYHARIIQQKYIQRELIRIGMQTASDAYSPSADIFDLIGDLEKKFTSLMNNFRSGSTAKTMVKLWSELEEKNQTLLALEGLSGVPSGYPAIDRTTGGWQKGNLIILAARPAMGKTALAICMAANAAIMFNKPGVIFSLEMSALELFTRLVSSESNISNNRFNRKGLPVEELSEVENNVSKLLNSDLYIDDTPGLTLLELKSKARKHLRDNKIEWLAVDYLQLMEGDSGSDRQNREQIVSNISRGLKGLAKELEIPIIALSQLSRGVEKRPGEKRPQLSDLRESGAIEQDADVVLFIHRPEYYGISEDENGFSTNGVAEIIFSKNRNGPLGTVYLKFIDVLTKFVDAEDAVSRVLSEPALKGAPSPNKFTESNKDENFPF